MESVEVRKPYKTSDLREKLRLAPAVMILGDICTAMCPQTAISTQWSTIFTAQTVRDRISTPQGREEALDFCRRLHLSKVYIEVFRDGYEAVPATLRAARDFFQRAGFQ